MIEQLAAQAQLQSGAPVHQASSGQPATQPAGLGRGRAFIIGINEYANPRWRLKNAVNDAEAIAKALSDVHHYEVTLLRDGEATLAALLDLLKALKEGPQRVLPNDRVVIYFGGHGLGYSDRGEFKGALLPQDVQLGIPTTYLDMQRLFQELESLECRHLLLVLDCCFAGLARAAMRDVADTPPLYKEQYYRFLKDKAWQLLASAGESQRASDGDARLGRRGEASGGHSPFAAALLKALESNAADCRTVEREPDYIVIAPELYQYVRDKVEQFSFSQTPGLWPLPKHGTGEFFFLLPGFDENRLEAAPELDKARNPYRGAAPYLDTQGDIFFGRHEMAHQLETLVAGPLTVLVGPSAAGKTSLVRAGLIPRLRKQKLPRRWQGGNLDLRGRLDAASAIPVVPIPNLPPHVEPAAPLDARLRAWGEAHSETLLLLIVDHCEEFFIRGREREAQQFFAELSSALAAHKSFLRILLVVRADMEPKLKELFDEQYWTADARCVVSPMQQDDLRDAIVEPARKSVLFFDPEDAVDTLINDLGPALPWVSRTLSELYTKTWQRWQAGDRSRVLKYEDYLDMGSISGVLGRQAEAVYEEFGQPAAAGSPESGSSAPGEPGKKQAIMQRVLLRMIDTDDASAEYGVRSVPLNELDYDTDQDVREVVERLAEAHLLVIGRHRTGEAYAMPAHPKLIQGWQRVREWHAAAETVLPLRLHRKLTRDAQDWHRTPPGRPEWLLWAGGSNLTGVEHTLTVAPERLNQLERDFARAGVALRERNERARKRRMMALVGLTITSLIAAVIAWLFAGEAQLQTRQAQREARAARVGQLTSEARSRVNNYPVQSLLISLEAITTTMNVGEPPLPVAQEMLYSSLSRVGGRGLSGHASSISALAISSDSRWLASASTDATIRLWDLTSPNPIAESVVLSGVTQPSTKLVFSPDSKRLLAKSNEQALLWHLEDTAGPLAPVVLRANVVAGRPPNAWGRTAFSPDSRWLSIFGGRTEGYTVKTVPGEAYLYMWDLSSDEVVAEGLALPLVGEYPNPGTYPPPPGYLPDEPPPVGPYPFIPTAIPTVGEYPNTYIAYAPTPQANPDTYPAYAPTPGDGLVPSTPGPMQASGDNPVDTLQAEQQFTLDSRWLYALLPSGIALWDLNDLSLPPVRLTDSAPTTVSANGRWAIVPSGGGIMELWDLGSLSANSVPQRFSLPTDGQPMVEPPTLSISPDGRWLAVRWLSTSGVENLSVWDFTAEALASSERILVRETAERQRPIDKFSFSPDSRWLFVSRPNSSMQRWSLEVPGLLPVEVRGSAQLLGFNVSGNGRWMVGVRSNLPNPSSTFALLWDLDNVGIAQSNTVLEGHDSWLDTTHAVFSADNRWLAIGDYNGMVRLWELTTPPSPALPIPLLPNGRGEFANVTLKPNSNELVTIDGKRMRVWNLASREPGLEPHTFKLGFEGRDELLSPDIRWLVFQSRKDQNQLDLNLLDLTAADPGASIRTLMSLADLQDTTERIITISSNSRWLMVAERNADVFLWDLTAADPVATRRELPRNLSPNANSPRLERATETLSPRERPQRAVIKIDDRTLNILDLTAQDPLASPLVLRNDSWEDIPVVSPDGRWLASWGPASAAGTGTAGTPPAGESATSEPYIELRDLRSAPQARAFSHPDFTLPAARSGFLASSTFVLSSAWLSFSNDGRWLTDGIYLWDLNSAAPGASARLLVTLEEGAPPAHVTFSPSGKWLATESSLTGGFRLYDLTSADPATNPVTIVSERTMAVMFSEDERWLITRGGTDPAVQLWPLHATELVELACRTVGRNLTAREWVQYGGAGDYRKTCPGLPSGEHLRTPGSDINDLLVPPEEPR